MPRRGTCLSRALHRQIPGTTGAQRSVTVKIAQEADHANRSVAAVEVGPVRSPVVYAAPKDARRRETVRFVVPSRAAMSRMELPRAVRRRTTSCCSTAVRSP